MVNTATATGDIRPNPDPDPENPDPEEPPVDPGREEDPTDNRNPHLTVTKVTTSTPANGTAYGLGEVIEYTVTVTNDGNVTIENVVAVDELAGAVVKEGSSNEPETLAPGESKEVLFQYEVQESDLGKTVVNTATATGDIRPNPDPDPENPDPEEPPVDPGREEDPTDNRNPHLTVTKVTTSTPANGTAYGLGEVIEYTVTVTNDGNVTIENVVAVDELAGAVVKEGSSNEPETLAPGESKEVLFQYEVQESDLGKTVVNTATATGDIRPNPNPDPENPDPEEPPVVPGEEEDPTIDRNPSLDVVKTVTSTPAAADGKYVVGETITYQVTVTNNGNLTLTDITVTDAMSRPDGTGAVPSGLEQGTTVIDRLAPGESRTITYDHVVAEADLGGNLTNAVTVGGTPQIPDPTPNPSDPEPRPQDETTITVITEDPSNCSIVVTKQTIDALSDELVTVTEGQFYVALFSDEAMTQRVGDVQAISFNGNQASSSVTFENLKRGTYYVAETDADGNVITTGEYGGGAYVPQYPNGNSVVITENASSANFTFNNGFVVMPDDGFYIAKTITITKKVKSISGKDKNVNNTFYAGIFADANYTKLSDTVSQNIVALDLNGNSSVSAEVQVTVPDNDEALELYITEVTADGTPVETLDDFGYNVEIDNASVTLSETSADAAVTITNTSVEEEEVESECESTETSSTSEEKKDGSDANDGNTSSKAAKSVKTGDETNITLYAALLLGAAFIFFVAAASRRRRKS